MVIYIIYVSDDNYGINSFKLKKKSGKESKRMDLLLCVHVLRQGE